MTKERILEYVASTPQNTNPNMIGNMIDALVEGSEPSGTIDISNNGTYAVAQYASATVNVPGIVPSGSIKIESNGEHDVTNYATAQVAVSIPNQQYKVNIVTGSVPFYIQHAGVLNKNGSFVFSYYTTQIMPDRPVAIPLQLYHDMNIGSEKVAKIDIWVPDTHIVVTPSSTYPNTVVKVGSTQDGTFIHAERALDRSPSDEIQMQLQLEII